MIKACYNCINNYVDSFEDPCDGCLGNDRKGWRPVGSSVKASGKPKELNRPVPWQADEPSDPQKRDYFRENLTCVETAASMYKTLFEEVIGTTGCLMTDEQIALTVHLLNEMVSGAIDPERRG